MNETVETTSKSLRILFALAGLHRVNRGAETAFESVAAELAKMGQDVTLIGSGEVIADRPYRFIHADCVPREWFVGWPSLPYFRTHYAYEEYTFARAMKRIFLPEDYDVTVTCGYPHLNRLLRNRGKTKHVFVTQNGDHMLSARQFDYRGFACDGLICTNPEILVRHQNRWPSVVIPNGVDLKKFHPGAADRGALGLPAGPIALMVSALIPSKRVLEGIAAASKLPELTLVIAGDGELRKQVKDMGESLMPYRFFMLNLPREKMPDLYRYAEVFLHMSIDEPSANAYTETLASGLPIVTHDRPVTRWTLEKTSVLVDTTDEAEVADALRKALDRRTEADIAARRELAERRFGWPMIAKQYLDFFRQVKA